MNEILKMLHALTADELDSVIMRATVILEKKRKEEAEAARREQERKRQELLQEQERRRQAEIAELQRKLQELQNRKTAVQTESGTTVGDNFVMYDAPKQAGSQKPVSAQPKAGQRIICSHCHTSNVDGSLFCENCGKKLSVPKAEPKPVSRPSRLSCPNCHHLNPPDSMFCENCGRKLA